MAEFDKVQDSGKRQKFNTGSVRDTDEGKGQPHLLPGEVMIYIEDNIGERLRHYKFDNSFDAGKCLNQIGCSLYHYGIIKDHETPSDLLNTLEGIIKFIAWQENKHYTDAFSRLAKHYQNGAIKYDKNNWRKGQPISRYYDSAMRHLWKTQANLKDEDHPSALFWNIVAIIQTKLDIRKGLLAKELDDFPFMISETFIKEKD